MDSSIISALAALAGAITGGLTSVLASWLTQHAQARAQWRAQDKLRRARTLQGIYRGGFEMLYQRTPIRQSRHTGTGRTLRQGGQDAYPVLAKGARERRVRRAKDHRYLSGA